jgi:hypothetical protein
MRPCDDVLVNAFCELDWLRETHAVTGVDLVCLPP